MPLRSSQIGHRVALGKAISLWFRQNEWSQQVPHDWAADADSEGPWNSQISLLMRGKHDPKAQFWVSLGEFNRTVAEQDFSSIRSQAVKERLREAAPFLTADSQTATATDFFSMFIGEAELSEIYLKSRTYDAFDALRISKENRKTFKSAALIRGLGMQEAWDELIKESPSLDPAGADILRDVLSGWSDWDPEQLNRLASLGDESTPWYALEMFMKNSRHILP